MATYSELRIRFEQAPDGDGYVLHVAGPSGKADGGFRLPTSKLELENLALRLSRGRAAVRRVDSPELGLARRFGSDLFDALFSGHVRDLYRDSLSVARSEGKGLRVTLALTNVPELMHVPWEYLYDDPAFLSISTWTPVVRYLDLPRGRPPLAVTQPLRILGMVSSPSDVVALDVGQEQRNLEQALADATARGAVEITWLERATLRDLQRAVRRVEYHVFHYIGHGGYDATLDDGVLLLEDDLGRSRRIGGAQLGTLLADEASLRLAVLNSCEGARTSSDDPYAGVATSLVQREVPAVVAMQFEITDRAALVFAGEFYAALADGYPVDSALAEARKAIFADENDVEWGTPVLYMRVPDGRIFDVTPAETGPVYTDPGKTEPIEAELPEAEAVETEPEAPPGTPPPPVVRPPAGRPERRPEPERVPVAATEPSASRRPAIQKRWLFLALAALALAALAAVLALVLRGGGGGTSTMSWSRRAPDPAVFGGAGHQEMSSVAPLPDGNAVAVGYDQVGRKSIPAVWTYESRDWQRQVKQGFGAGDGTFNGVAVNGSTIVAVGTAGPTGKTSTGDPRQDALVWAFSGGSWQQVCKSACGDGVAGGGHHGQTMYAVTLRPGGGFVAVGYDVADQDRHFDAAVWTSADGLDWSRVTANSRVFGGARDQVMRTVTATKSGLLVAAGWDGHGGALWTSSRDGRQWTRISLDPFQPVFGNIVRLTGVIQEGNRLIAVGFEGKSGIKTNRAVAWASSDPRARSSTWHKLMMSEASNKRGQALVAVGRTRVGPIAVGYDHGANKREVAAVWQASGALFKPVRSGSFAGAGDFEMNAITQLTDGGLLAVGDAPSADRGLDNTEQDAQIWTARAGR